MAGNSSTGRQGRLTTFAKVMLGVIVFLWTLVILPIITGFIPSIITLPKEWVAVLKKPFDWAVQNPVSTALIFICLILLTVVLYQFSRSRSSTDTEELPRNLHVTLTPALPPSPVPQVAPQPVAHEKLPSDYLQRMIRRTEWLNLTGIPAGLFAPRVQLDEVFIPLEFFPKRPPSDYPFTSEEVSYYSKLLREGKFTEAMERVFLGREKTWEELLRRGERISIAQLWQQLDRDNPAAVIQGYPGMGKSTLMARLTLHMARCGLGLPDPTMGQSLHTSHPFSPVPVPLLLLLKDYAVELEKALKEAAELPLLNYLKVATDRLHMSGLFDYLHDCLQQGRCLVMFDGLDEVSKLDIRKRVKQEIENFILDFRDKGKNSFNRFLVTSRVAGYDVVALSDYLHFTVAELTPKQIEDFLPRWCRAGVQRDALPATGGQREREEAIQREAEVMRRRLSQAIRSHPGAKKLAENPLLLTLLAVMQQNSIVLPERRVELYTVVTKTLLENRNKIKDIESIPEALAIQRLGPIAYTMQESGNNFARQRNVKEELRAIIQQEEGGTAEQIEREVEDFLERIRVRGGLFVIRTGDYFGFFHRTFQEYFAARHILNLIKGDKRTPNHWIETLVKNARSSDDLWREPFLLAVAYQSGEDEHIARTILSTLLTAPQGASFASWAHDLLLAAECLLEAQPATIGAALEGQVAVYLLQTYEQAQRQHEFDTCDRIESVMQRWLLSLPKEAYRPTPLMVLTEAICDAAQPARHSHAAHNDCSATHSVS